MGGGSADTQGTDPAGTSHDQEEGKENQGRPGFFQTPPALDALVNKAVERVFRLLDLPRRSDVESLNQNLERVARAMENLEQSFTPPASASGERDTEAGDLDDR